MSHSATLLAGWLALSLPTVLTAQYAAPQQYLADLRTVAGHSLVVTVPVADETVRQFRDTVTFHFAKTIPGTYAELDYGRFVDQFQAFGPDGLSLPVLRPDPNTFLIVGHPDTLRYTVRDTYHHRVKKNKVFEPAGSNIQQDRNLVLNNAAFFGFFAGSESQPIELALSHTGTMSALSSMSFSTQANGTLRFQADNYHDFVDNPILLGVPDTTSFQVANCRVTIGIFNESGRPVSADIHREIEGSMLALARFFDDRLPVDEYHFLLYLRDYTEFQPLLDGEKASFLTLLRAFRQLKGQAFGALEHGTSSFYFLPDFGNDLVVESVKDVAIHEFLHILTPLNLHSEHIEHFDYIRPTMCRHLWLYEGVTEYFAGLTQVQGQVINTQEYLQSVLRGKIRAASSFPESRMSFTEMSEHVFEEPFKSQYMQVYQRGALLGALLDIELIALTDGRLTLRDVIFDLSRRYGPDAFFDADRFPEEFVAASHPGIQSFFDRCIAGREPLPVADILAKAGVVYSAQYVGEVPASPFEGLSFKKLVTSNLATVKKVKKRNTLGFLPGDKVDRSEAARLYGIQEFGFQAGTAVDIPVQRNGRLISIPFTTRLESGKASHVLYRLPNPTPAQQTVFRRWLAQP
ncbi:MAG: hypothetical protein RLY31_144 [Bacteroidota bacterium]|jgi:predicted metalloprotease with PDZ domain